ncbi:hypothetical protein INT44_006697 [Umbelopsis vinacea]|uniref:HAT C-terminal dimerisation domain-containing protein n=1 Tax=Umbelopsis vinacea TaxID=44442 RepID=A0A8H7U8E8_9FUNG|nr:hypothetical protein INT44_006697 [Umbelopsis vinacea]
MDMDDFLEMYKSKVLCDIYHLTTKHRSSLNQVITREMSMELNTDSESNLNADDLTVSTTSQEAHLPSVRSLGPRRNQSWVLRNGHAVTVTINSVLKLKCIYCNAFLRYLLVRMAVDCKLPFQFIESVSFRSVVDYLRSCTPGKAVLPSSDTFRRQMLDMYEEKSLQIKAILRGQRWISYTADLWTSPWKVPYFAITAHWINDEWKKKELLLLSTELKVNIQVRENIARMLVDTLRDMDLLKSFFTITTDNASNMLNITHKIQEAMMNSGISHSIHRMFCIGHAFNLAVQQILHAGINSEAMEPNPDGYRNHPDPRQKHIFWGRGGLFDPVEISSTCDRVREVWQEFKPPDQPQERTYSETFFRQLPTEDDELQSYLNESLHSAKRPLDLLQYWKRMEADKPYLAQMAKKYLAVCATSTPSERCFSQARLFIPHLRNRLKPESFKSTMLLWSWLNLLQDNEE